MEDKTTAEIVGFLKSMDKLAVNANAGGVTIVVTSSSGLGAIATAGGIASEEIYKVVGADKSFNDYFLISLMHLHNKYFKLGIN